MEELVTEDFTHLLSKRDASTEVFLHKLMALLKLPINSTPDEIHLAWTNQLSDRVSEKSAILWHRLNPYIQILLQKKMHNCIHDQMVLIDSAQESLDILVNKYKKCFNAWIDYGKISFNTSGIKDLGDLSMKDYFILQFYILGTNTRVRGDGLLQLGVVGKSSVGKSTLFEAPLAEISHYFVETKGTGRFKTESKTILFFHDIDVKILVKSKDTDLIKTLCRSEPTSVKVHSGIISIPPIHLLYTSNTKLFNHKIEGASLFTRNVVSDIVVDSATIEHVNSIRHRFLECYCAEQPNLNLDWFPENGTFSKTHMVLGLFERILNILDSYGPTAFVSKAHTHYILAALAKHANAYEQVFSIPVKHHIESLVDKYISKSCQKTDILKYMQ